MFSCNVCNQGKTLCSPCISRSKKISVRCDQKFIYFFYCCTVHVVTIIVFFCCTVHVVTIIAFIVAPCILLRLLLLLLHRACCYDYRFYCCTVHVVTIIAFIPTHAHIYTSKHQFTLILKTLKAC